MRLIIQSVSLILLVSCSDSNDPSTESKADLNPPSGLKRIIQDGAVKLYWQGNNPEKDFQGYYVFGSNTSWSDLRALIKYPAEQSDRTWQKSTGIPRCTDNNDFFAKFGIPATKTTCSGSGISDESSDTSTDTEMTTENEFKNIILNCNDRTEDLNLSLKPTSGGATFVVGSTQECTVKKVYDTSSGALVDMTNGTAMTFMALSVMGSELTKVSWASNIVEAAGSKEISISFDLEKGNFKTLDFSALISAGTVAYTGGGTCTTSVCRIGQVNSESDISNPKIWFARHSTNNAQRVLISSSSAATNMEIFPRGNNVYDPLNPGTVSARTPDTPVEAGYLKGEIFPVYGLNTFDFRVTLDAKTYYGKVVISEISYSDTSDTGISASTATIKLSVIYQPGESIAHYLHSDESHE